MTRGTLPIIASVVLLLLMPQHAASQQPQGGGRANQASNPNDPRGTNRTIYSEKTELFITFRPQFIVGQSVRIGAHLSKLGGARFLPYADAEVTATLTVAGVSTKTLTPKPDRPGVFRLELTPTKAGTGTLVVDITGRDGSDRLVLEEMTVYADRADAVAHQGPDPDAGAIRYSKEQSWDENEYASAPVGRVAFDSSSQAQRVLAVPRTALVDVDGLPHVYVQRHPEAFDLREVKTGRNNGTYVEIIEGLREGQRIVIRGGDKMPRN